VLQWLIVIVKELFRTYLVVLFFAMGEYFRSWVNFYADRWDSYWGFALSRLAAYYMTALNNGAGMFENYDTLYMPLNTADWFWKFPIEIVPGGMPALFNINTTPTMIFWCFMRTLNLITKGFLLHFWTSVLLVGQWSGGFLVGSQVDCITALQREQPLDYWSTHVGMFAYWRSLDYLRSD
jgi:hypothetical protein